MKKLLAFLPMLLLGRFASADVATADETLTKQVGADAASQITFEPGRATLTSAEISALNDLVSQARMNGEKIDEVKVFVWGDKVYSETAGNAATKQERKVADQRIENIKKYLKKDLKVSDIETFNMARQPRAFTDLINASGSKVNDLASAGKTATTTTTAMGDTSTTTMSQNQALTQFAKGNPSEALVLIYKK